MKPVTRPARADDSSELKNVWKVVFGDTDDYIDAFFRYYNAENATVITIGGEIAAAGYLLPVGDLKTPDGVNCKCAMIYSVAVLSEYRSRGLGTVLTRALIGRGNADGYPAVVLCPASDGLYEYYAARTTLRSSFYACEFAGEVIPGGGTLIPLAVGEYARLRGEFLSNTAHIAMDERALSFQYEICKLSDGGLFAVRTPKGEESCAVIERDDGCVAVKELLTAGSVIDAAAAVASVFPADRYVVKSTARVQDFGKVRRYGMLALDWSLLLDNAWYGLAFD